MRRWPWVRRLRPSVYPHTLTGIFASSGENTIRKNAMLLPAYTLLLGWLALLGYMGHAAGLQARQQQRCGAGIVQDRCFRAGSPASAFAAIAIGALVPAAVMSIGAADLFTRNFWKVWSQSSRHAGG